MKRSFRCLTFLPLILFAFCVWSAPLSAREIVSLDGEWDFATDSYADGSYATQTGKIQVPGIWNNQGFGPENEKVRFNYIGVGHYRRVVSVPESWKGRSVFLVLTGISRYATVRVNGEQVGKEAIGCIGSHEWDLTDALEPGKNAVLEIDVDSRQRWGIDPLLGAAQLNDYMLIVWGGIWGHARLEARPAQYLKDVFIKPDVQKSEIAVEFDLVGGRQADSVKVEVFEWPTAQEAKASVVRPIQENASVTVPIPGAKLWTPDSPNLYVARVTLLKDGQVTDSLETRFGMREIRFDGSKIFLNGKRFFLRGYGDDHIYPVEYSMSCDKEMYLRRLRIIKSFGFNHVRHHSTILPHEYYEACDEIGMLPNAEFLIGYPGQLPGWGNLWKNGNPENLPPEVACATMIERFDQVLREYRNHPSIFAWVFGNELNMAGSPWDEMPLRKQSWETAKRLDPTRPFMDLDGDWPKSARAGRDTIDLLSVLFDEWSNPVTNLKKFELEDLGKPVIAHEMGNYLTFSRPDQIDLFEGTAFKPFWMVDGKAKLEELGLLNEAEAWALASERLYFFLHKSGLESLRKNPMISGYHWWLIQDYWTTSNGLVDLFFRPKSVRPEEVRMVNAPVVLLADGLERTYRSGETMELKFLVSNFSEAPINGEFTAEISLGDRKETRKFPVKDAPIGEVSSIGEVAFPVPALEKPEQVKITVSLTANVPNEGAKTTQINQNVWTSWFFPAEIRPDASIAPAIYADEMVKYAIPDWNLQSIPDSDKTQGKELPANAVYIVSWLDADVASAVKRGARCVLLGDLERLESIPITYKQTWWKAGDSEAQNHCGTFVYSDSLTDSVTRDHWCDGAWCELLDGANKFKVESAPTAPQTLIRALPSLVLVQNTPLVFRVRVGSGLLTVSGLNHFSEGALKNPLNAWLVREMLYPVSAKETLPSWPVEFLAPEKSLPPGMSLGFRKVISSPRATSGLSYYSPNTTLFIARQTEAGNLVSWQTNPTATPNAETTTFLFAGGLGWITQPVTEGFELSVNGQAVLRFDLPEPNAKSAEWKSTDGSVTLRFDVVKIESHGEDFLGRFSLTIPTTSLLPNGTAQITVKSLGSGSNRWFALNTLRSFEEKE
ncbi:MAG: glycoside hydrolase family 2 TIM barrel-domain containing protein [Thermoguttaceae bacterium]|nr:glycoside hydrolase family 2 TIM barrel-domain containing protein [Thermoguttaceae bacterium]